MSKKIRLIKKRVIIDRLAISYVTVHRLISGGLLPKPVKIGKLALWPEHEIDSIANAVVAGVGEEKIKLLVAELEANRKIDVQ